MLVLGIESTAHTFGIGIVDGKEKKVLFNEKSQFKNDVGMDPRKLSDFHVANFEGVLKKAKEFLISIGKEFKDLDLISFSRGPGMGNALKIGSLVAKSLSVKYKIPIVGVNHIKAHLEIGKMLTGFSDPVFLYVSGVNTQIIAKDDFGKYKIYGETEDIGLGNLLDSFGRLIGFDFPAGPIIERVAKEGKNFLEVPMVIKGMNVSMAGIYSNLKTKFEKGESREDLCFSLQESAFAQVLEVVERAIMYTQKKEFLIVGGVGANSRLKEMAKGMCELRGIEFAKFDFQYVLDNGAMIAWEGFVDKDRASLNISDLKPLPYINVQSKI
ncbi:MAG: tRNA (adenosine(37)-N6)-threonylcarbamoyltransferase complex transferase subunit TsaD [bacterium]